MEGLGVDDMNPAKDPELWEIYGMFLILGYAGFLSVLHVTWLKGKEKAP